jgi:hypothetical protein
MGKHRAQRLIEIDGVFHRMRRGKLVPIPPQWVGATTRPQTIDGRSSKLPRKVRMALGHGRNPRRLAPRHCRRLRRLEERELLELLRRPRLVREGRDVFSPEYFEREYECSFEDGFTEEYRRDYEAMLINDLHYDDVDWNDGVDDADYWDDL